MSLTKAQVKLKLIDLADEWKRLSGFMGQLALDLLDDLPAGVRMTVESVEKTVGSTVRDGTPDSASFQALCGAQEAVLRQAGKDAIIAPSVAASLNVALAAVLKITSSRNDMESNFTKFFAGARLSDAQFSFGKAQNQLKQSLKTAIEKATELFQTPPSELDDLRDAVDSLSSYPVLVSDVSPPGGSWGGGGTALASGTTTAPAAYSLVRVVDSAMRDVLGRIPRQADPRSFVSALNASFEITEDQGHTSFTWRPRAYAGQSDLGGGITGAQASLWSRIRVAIDNAGPLLDKLYSLKIDFDPQKVDALRSIIRTTFRTLVDELGIEGGPRPARVDNVFDQLLGTHGPLPIPFNDTKPTGDFAGSLFGQLQLEMGLIRSNVTTLDEETNLSNFIALRDYIDSLRFSWVNYRPTIAQGTDLGTGLVLLSRALSVASESVQEIYAAMDSVFVGDAERRVASFVSEAGDIVIVADLLSWITEFATNEAPSLIYDGGIIGANRISSTVNVLVDLVTTFIELLGLPGGTLPEGMKQPRVIQPVIELNDYLSQISTLVQRIRG